MRLVTRENGLRAYMLLAKNDMGKEVDSEKIKTILQKSGVTYGVKLDHWEEVFQKFSKGQLNRNSILVAEGKEPIPGEPGKIEYFVPLMRRFPIKKHERNFLDDILIKVKRGQPIFRLHPPGEGTAGMTVTGDPIPAPPGEPAEPPPVKNIGQHPQDPNTYVALIDGTLNYHPEKGFTIWPLEEIPRAISRAFGELDIKHSLLVHGDIKSGSQVQVAGDLFVLGVVEDAQVSAGGDIYILNGFVGRGKGVIRAGNNVYVQHVDNQTIYAENDIYVDDEAMNCQLHAGRNVIFTGKKSCIIGGKVEVGEKLRVYRAGNVKHIQTLIHIAQDDELIAELKNKQKELAYFNEELANVKHNIFRFVKTTAGSQPLPEKLEKKFREWLRMRDFYDEMIARLKKEIEEMTQRLARQRSRIRIEITGPAYPGVHIRHGKRTYQIYRPSYNLAITYDDF